MSELPTAEEVAVRPGEARDLPPIPQAERVSVNERRAREEAVSEAPSPP